ncbi:MAG: porin family protein [Saprospiraceae bacterium]
MRNTVPFSFFIALLLLATAGTATAQNFGVRAGVVSSDLNFIVEDGDDDGFRTDRITNLAIGLFVELPVSDNIAVQPELNYLGRGAKSQDDSDDKLRLSYLDIGALLKFRINADAPVGFYAGAGPFLGYAVSGKDSEGKIDFDDEDNFRRIDLSLAGAAGVTFGSSLRFFGELRYSHGLSNLFKEDDFGDDAKLKNNAILLTGGVMVPLGN